LFRHIETKAAGIGKLANKSQIGNGIFFIGKRQASYSPKEQPGASDHREMSGLDSQGFSAGPAL